MAVSPPGKLHVYSPFQMNTETEDDFYQSEDDDLDEDEATQYIIEQSLIQYRKLKGLNPRLAFQGCVLNVSLYIMNLLFIV